MELLKFSDGPKTSRRGKNPAGFIGAGIMVAVMGLSSTLAGTITIASGTVEFGQGVVSTAACDSEITVVPTSSYSYANDTFTVSSITVEGIGGNEIGDELGCLGQVLEFRAYDSSGALLEFVDNEGAEALTITLPESLASTETSSNYVINGFTVSNGVPSTSANGTQSATVAENVAGSGSGQGFNNTAAAATGQGSFIIGNLSMSGTVTRITVESRSPRSSTAAENALP